ncbi:threonine aldolase family protein [Lacibacterium aquatile]|uniref:L-threonine aldolase n=1 Tax=Lacibacterium aquatile TaxID=1168082 RepID=A0ABW5DSB5_9PROT
MNFASDNVAAVPAELLDALVAANQDTAKPYGEDEYTALAGRRFWELFECELVMLPVATGTAANCLGLACVTPPWGAIYCHQTSHIEMDECGAPEFFTGGAKLVKLPGHGGKIDAATLGEALSQAQIGSQHKVQPAALSLSQATEFGTVYTPDEVRSLADVAHSFGMKVHMDGARFANAVASLGCSPAELTWQAGVDIMTFGATKNGALGAEAVLFFDPALAESAVFRRKRAGHLFSKMRYLSAQLAACLADGRWLSWAHHANSMAQMMANGLAQVPGARLEHPVQANEIFITLPSAVVEGLLGDGFWFYRWGDPEPDTVRLITAWNTQAADVERFIDRALFHAAHPKG